MTDMLTNCRLLKTRILAFAPGSQQAQMAIQWVNVAVIVITCYFYFYMS